MSKIKDINFTKHHSDTKNIKKILKHSRNSRHSKVLRSSKKMQKDLIINLDKNIFHIYEEDMIDRKKYLTKFADDYTKNCRNRAKIMFDFNNKLDECFSPENN